MEQRSKRIDSDERLGQQERLLWKLVNEQGEVGAAAELGLSDRTIRRYKKSGVLSPMLRTALERELVLREQADLPGSRWEMRLSSVERGQQETADRITALEERIAVEGERTRAATSEAGRQAADGVERVERALSELASAQQEHGKRLEEVEKKRQEAPPVKTAGSVSPAAVVPSAPSQDGAVHDEETEAALSEWRRLKDEQAGAGTRLEEVTVAEKRLMSEIMLIREHRVPIPPDERWNDGDRSRELTWRWAALRMRRGQRRRLALKRWVRRVLTLGLWWR